MQSAHFWRDNDESYKDAQEDQRREERLPIDTCALQCGDVSWQEGRAVIIGKGDKEAVVHFSRLALGALKDYINVRTGLDGASGRPLTALPLFARHGDRTSDKILPITITTGRIIVSQRVREALGEQAVGSIISPTLSGTISSPWCCAAREAT